LYDGLAMEAQIQAELAAAMDGFDVLLAPTSAVAGLEADASYLDGITIDAGGIGRDGSDGDVGGLRLDHYWQAHMTMAFNICNRVAIVNVPAVLADCVLPAGVTATGPPL